MKTLMIFLLFFSFYCSKGQTINHEGTPIEKSEINSMSTQLMTERIKDSAKQHKNDAPVPRATFFDFAFAADSAEFKELNTFGIFYIATLAQDKNEYPIKRVYIKTSNEEADLIKLNSLDIPVNDSEIKNVFGENRVDYYFFIPYFYTKVSGELIIDWNINRQGFGLCKFPYDVKLNFTIGESIYPDKTKQLNPNALIAFMEREFHISMKAK
jgi:hypothetical protein